MHLTCQEKKLAAKCLLASHVLYMLLAVVILLCQCIMFAFLFPTNATWQPIYVVHDVGISAKAIWLPMCLYHISRFYLFLFLFALDWCCLQTVHVL